MVSYEENDSIRQSVASCLKGLIRCDKETNDTNLESDELISEIGISYLEHLWKAIKIETDVCTMTCQIESFQQIIKDIRINFLDKEMINSIVVFLFERLRNSQDKIE